MTNAPSSCPGCGQPFDAARATYDKNGNLQCDACATRGQIAVVEGRAATSIISAAGGILGAGVTSLFCFNPLGLMSLAATISGASWLIMVGSNQSLRQSMGSKYMSAMVMAAIGTALGVLGLAASALKMLGIVLTL